MSQDKIVSIAIKNMDLSRIFFLAQNQKVSAFDFQLDLCCVPEK